MRFARVLLCASLVWLLGASVGCAPETDDGHLPRGDGGDHDGAVDPADVASLAVSPATVTLDVTDLAALPSTTLTAVATMSDGTTQTVSASWTIDRFDVASVGSATGVVSAVGNAFGKAKVTAMAAGHMADAEVTVTLHLVDADPAIGAGDKATLDAAAATDPAVSGLAYPYDKTVFPRALLAPELMWNGGGAGDAYRVRYTATDFDLIVYTLAAPPSRYTIAQALWNALGATVAGGEVTVELRRLAGATAYVSATQKWKVADANLRGSIYYWAVSQGQIVNLDVTSGTRTLAFDSGANTVLGAPTPLNSASPATPVWEDNGAGKRCVACHAVSKDGSRLVSVFTRGGSQGPIGSVALAGSAVTAVSDYQTNGMFTAVTPDGNLSVANFGGKTMQLLDATTGLGITSALDGVADLCDPTFSPDGKRFAVAANCDPGFGNPVEYRRADLRIYDFAQATRVFDNPQTVVASAGVGDAIAFPSFSPDSSLIVFQRGDYSRAKYGDTTMGQYLHGADDLYVARAQPSATAIALDAANGVGVLGADNLHLNYAPTVNPIASGGYIWVVFTSPRDYGNRMVSPHGVAPNDATYANHKQLWVTAVDATLGTTDPSHPAFWLPGQDDATTNMFGYWSLSPCKPTTGGSGPSSCAAGFECCSGYCRDSGSGPVCVDAPTGCHNVGEKCTVDADCCGAGMGVSCVAGICQGVTIN
jgi:hypothetical protein